jgi:hypothetical protein
MGRPLFTLRVRAEPGVHAIRSLRALLKVMLRTFGLRCVSIEQQETTMDMRQFSSKFIKPDDVREAPFQAHIVAVTISEKYGRPVLELDTGEQFTVNTTNNKTLIKAYGGDSDDWRGHLIELSLGHYKDWNTEPPEDKETVVLTAISPREPGANGGPSSPQRVDPAKLPAPLPKPAAKPTFGDDLDDSIPFN